MKFRLYILLAACFGMAFLASCGSDESAASLEEYSLQTLANDLPLHIVPTGERYGDLITITLRFPAGQAYERSGEAGFSSLATRFLAEADSTVDPGSKFFIENHEDAITLSVQFLRSEINEALMRLRLRLQPVVSEEVLNVFKRDLVAAYESNRQNPLQKVRDTVNGYLYPDTALAFTVEDRIAAINGATVEGVQAFLARSIRPEEGMVAVSGAITEEMLSSIVRSLGEWVPSSARPLPASLPNVEEVSTQFEIINAEADSAEFYMIRSLPKPAPEDLYPMRALNYILNGSVLGSRLALVENAMAGSGSVRSSLMIQPTYSGQILFGRTPTASLREVVSATRTQLEILIAGNMNEKRILEQELLDARNYLSNSLLRNTQTGRQLNAYVLWAAEYGFSDPLPGSHVGMINRMTEEDLHRALDTYHRESEIINALVLHGPQAELQAQFSNW